MQNKEIFGKHSQTKVEALFLIATKSVLELDFWVAKRIHSDSKSLTVNP